ncbi:hypothetical protein K1T71_008011 [Dendrolimus kikuchii]|uniref:Uncharacterized protein n=1 Tax=Dendrolimus kikuchii TaxID=765133 RepID=A0ACC1CZW1_9NEOP|nr:hypothetical protein K1T71_008011 [Dendrolimus kikuchii]
MVSFFFFFLLDLTLCCWSEDLTTLPGFLVLCKAKDGTKLIVVPKKMQNEIIRKCHEKGHFGILKTEELINRDYYIDNCKEKFEIQRLELIERRGKIFRKFRKKIGKFIIKREHKLYSKNARQAAKKICDVYRPNAVSVRVAQIWFKRFQSRNFDIKDARRSGRPVTDKIDAIFEKVEQDRHISNYDVAGELGLDHKTVLAHLKKAGYTKKLDIWVPHEFTERNLMNRVLICDSLLRRNETEPFLKKLITGDEKWITYDKNGRKRSWSKAGQASQTVAKPGLTRNKVMLCVWWDWKGIIHYELLPPGRIIDS